MVAPTMYEVRCRGCGAHIHPELAVSDPNYAHFICQDCLARAAEARIAAFQALSPVEQELALTFARDFVANVVERGKAG